MTRQSFHATTFSTIVPSFPRKLSRQLTNIRASTQKPCIRCLSGFARFDTKTRTTPSSFVDRRFEVEATLDRRTSGSAFVCNSGYYWSDATLYFDGSSRGAKGPGGGGAFLLDIDGECIWEGYRFCRKATCTQAEYHGLILGLNAAREAELDNLTVYGDADIVLDQMTAIFLSSPEHLNNSIRRHVILPAVSMSTT